jgi:OOP family OmpA-OmpF porin
MSDASAQTQKYPNSFTYKVLGVDTYSPYLEELYRFDKQTFAFSAEYSRYLGKSFSLSLPLRIGTMDYPYLLNDFYEGWNFYSQDAAIRYGFSIDESKKWQPYMTAGLGFMYIPKAEETWETQFPVGLGLNIEILEGINLQLSTEFRFSEGANAWHNGIGLQFLFNTEKDEVTPDENTTSLKFAPDVNNIVRSNLNDVYDFNTILDDNHLSSAENQDSDKDGIPNDLDLCPDVFGESSFSGCPIIDSDNDGLADMEDRCPGEAGTYETAGCPDSDGDFVIDRRDLCPNEPGTRACKGCPDSDGDKVADNIDQCPTEPGLLTNEGCPQISETEIVGIKSGIQPIIFQENGYELLETDYKSLEYIISFMTKYPNSILSISGYAFDGQDAKYNEVLSVLRARICFDYLIRKGISEDRITYSGFGNSKEVDFDKLKTGVDFHIFL